MSVALFRRPLVCGRRLRADHLPPARTGSTASFEGSSGRGYSPAFKPTAAVAAGRNPLRRTTLIIVFLALILFVLWGFMEKRTPSTSRAQFQVYVVGIASEVTGRDIRVLRPAERVGCSAIRPTEPRPAPSPTASCWPAVPAASSVDVVAPRPYRIAQRAGDADIDDLFPFNFTQTATA